jgi:5-methylcytosine-specific restriction protein A
VLFDENGFVIVTSKNDLHAFGIKVAKRTNVPHRIASLPTYQLLSSWRIRLPEELPQENIQTAHREGSAVTITVNRYERDRKARIKCIAHYGCVCHACGVRLSDIYGSAADGFIHVHHITPISSVKSEYELDPILDLRPLCPNCHAVAHLRIEPYSIEELRAT